MSRWERELYCSILGGAEKGLYWYYNSSAKNHLLLEFIEYIKIIMTTFNIFTFIIFHYNTYNAGKVAI